MKNGGRKSGDLFFPSTLLAGTADIGIVKTNK